MNIFKIVFSNIKKRKGASITFLIMVILSAFMLSISLSLIIGGNSFFEKKSEEFNSPHYSNNIVTSSYQDNFWTFAKNYDGATDVSLLDVLICPGAWNMKSGTFDTTVVLLDESELKAKSFQKLTVIDKQIIEAENMIILPVSFRANGFKSGEIISLNLSGKTYEFTIYGFFEDVLMGASTNGLDTAYLGTETFKKLKNDDYFTSYKNLSVRFSKSEECTAFKTAFNKVSNLNANEELVTTYDGAKAGAMTFVNVASVVLIIFSLIILMIAFIIARFSINSTIQEDITTIGALKSIGYKNKTLRGSQLLQYLIIAGLGSIIGSLVSFFTFGLIGDTIASTSGFLWINSVNIIPVILSISIICGLTSFITFIVTRKYNDITPINALRQGESHHSFRKNAMPLDKYKIALNLHLGLKRCCKNLKNNITLFVVVSLLVFISSLVFTMSYNLNVDTTAMVQMVGLEMAEVWVQAGPELDINEINTVINSHNEVNHTLLTGSSTCSIEDLNSNIACVENFSALISDTVVKGRYPELYNEIALGSTIAKATGKGLGDTVTVEINGIKMNYIVVGITQDIGNGGDYCNITSEAMLSHNSEFTMDTIYVYLNEVTNAKDYIENLNGIYGNQILTANPDEKMDGILGSLGGPFAAISVVMIIITIVIIGVVLFLLISTLIRKDKKEFGIMKAIGYKNRQLTLQILISMLLPLILGTLLGIALGFIVTNPLLSVVFSSMGLLSTYFIIPLLPTLLIGLGIFGVSVITTCMISLRLKKISPQKLIVEY